MFLGLQMSMVATPSWAVIGYSIDLWKDKGARTDISIGSCNRQRGTKMQSCTRYSHEWERSF